MIYKASSSTIGLIAKGMFEDIFIPWKIEIDTDRKQIIIRKRNWYLIGVDEDTHSFSTIRNISIDNYIFGADLHIRIYYGGQVTIFALKKSDAKRIKELLM